MRMGIYFKDKKVLGFIIVILICLLSIPFFTYTVPYELHRTSQYTSVEARAGDTVDFKITFWQVGGRSDKEIRIVERDNAGDWETDISQRTVRVPPDSVRNITIAITVPEDAQTGDEYEFEYELQGDYQDRDEFRVNVENEFGSRSPFLGYLDGSQSSSDFALTPFVFIPEIIIVICLILILVSVRKTKTDEEQGDSSQN